MVGGRSDASSSAAGTSVSMVPSAVHTPLDTHSSSATRLKVIASVPVGVNVKM